MEENKKVPAVVIKRLPRYYRYLGELLKQDIKRISSGALSQKMNVTASQIRQDFNYFGGFGQQGYGYNVEYLYSEIGKILGLNDGDTMIIVGAGNLGQALANYVEFEKKGLIIKGIFDVNPRLIGNTVRGIEIHMIDEMEDFIRKNRIEIAALTVPKSKAEDMAKLLVQYGVKGIWNFANIDLHTIEGVVVENVHLSESLMRLSYRTSKYIKETESRK